MRRKREVVPEWHDFLTFVMDVGEPPSGKSKLYRGDDDALIGPENFVWKDAYTQRVEGEDEKTFRSRRQRAYRHVRKEDFAGYDLKRHYGLSAAQYEAMQEAQNHKCAICGGEESTVIRGKVVRMAVDHCHETGKVRELLCRNCNMALGGFKDSIDRLKSAITYLETHHPEKVS